MREALRLSLTTLTVVPARATRLDRGIAGRAMELAPVAGLVVGVAAAGATFLVRVLGAPHLLAAVVAIGTLAVLTRGLHLDGLADLVDGLSSYRDPAGTREVMKAPDLGPLGAVALMLVLLVQVSALDSALAQHRGTTSLLAAVVAGRVAITAACVSTPAAAPDGMGALVAGTVRPVVARAWMVLTPLVAGSMLAADGDATRAPALRLVLGVAAVVVGLLAARGLRAHAVRRVGGITGDVLGALCETASTATLLVLGLAS